jgi:hypothetical protein
LPAQDLAIPQPFLQQVTLANTANPIPIGSGVCGRPEDEISKVVRSRDRTGRGPVRHEHVRDRPPDLDKSDEVLGSPNLILLELSNRHGRLYPSADEPRLNPALHDCCDPEPLKQKMLQRKAILDVQPLTGGKKP